MTFIDNPNNLPYVNHKDFNKLNPHAANLEWCTAEYNTIYSCGIKVNKLDKKTGQILKTYNSCSEAYKDLGKKCSGAITQACAGKRKTVHGFRWSFCEN
jgi:hypothetical protein